jgi:uncharacterized protein (TIGR00106 family)
MLCQFSISPAGQVSMSSEVAKIIDLIDRSGLMYKTHAMGTIVEGDWDEIMRLIKRCHELMLSNSSRVTTTIMIDDRKDAKDRLAGKVEAVERRLGRKIKS